ncbi:MAG: carbon-nitrogen hydrolase family protein [Hyphomicrobiales bacterium]
MFQAGLVQMRSGRDPSRNIADATRFIDDLARRGANLILTPEMTNIIETDRERLKHMVRPEGEDQSVAALSESAKSNRVWLLAGSLALRNTAGMLVNRSLLFDPQGRIQARYDKIHLFDVDLPDGTVIRESAAYASGRDAPIVPLLWGNLGLTICYDVRFPALYKSLALAGADFITVPSAFTRVTGEAHWHVLLRARAIETGSFILAPAQGGLHECGRETFGASLAVSPWGEIIAEADREPGTHMVTLDGAEVDKARRRIPALRHGRRVALSRCDEIAT